MPPGSVPARVLALLVVSLAAPARVEPHGPIHEQIAQSTARIAADPTNPSLLLRRGELHRAHGDREAAAGDQRCALDIDPTFDAARLALAPLALEAGHPDEALAAARRFLERHPAMFVSLNVLGSMALDVDGNRLDGFFLDDTGAVRGRFTMLKGAGRLPRTVPDGSAVAGTPSTAYHLLDGFGSPAGPIVPSGARCGLGVLGRYDWAPPAMPVGEDLLWCLVVGSDGLTREGSWGRDSGGAQEGAGPSGFCLVSSRDLTAGCP